MGVGCQAARGIDHNLLWWWTWGGPLRVVGGGTLGPGALLEFAEGLAVAEVGSVAQDVDAALLRFEALLEAEEEAAEGSLVGEVVGGPRVGGEVEGEGPPLLESEREGGPVVAPGLTHAEGG